MKRSRFLKNVTAGVVMPKLVNGFNMQAFAASPALENQLAINADKVLVMVRLDGGNDGINTVIPKDRYSQLATYRSNLLIPENQVLSLTGSDAVGLHPAMTGLRGLYNDGKVKIIQGVAYPNQTQSHFRSTDIWMSASDTADYVYSGFAGRYLDYQYPGFPNGYPNTSMPDPLGIEIAHGKSLMFEGASFGNSIPITSTNAFYNLLNGIQTPAPANTGGEQLSYIRTVQRQSNAYSQTIVDAAANVTSQLPYPDTEIAQALKIVARLIGGGLRTKLYMVSLGGFDTHEYQATDHARILKELSDAIKSFMDDITMLGAGDQVMGITFSEFGRRIESNDSAGTDHGEAAPMFLFGNKISGGILGNTPDVANDVANNWGNVAMQFDFRSIYTTILQDWFCVPASDIPTIMMGSFNTIPVLRPEAICTRPLPVHLMLFAGRLNALQQGALQWRTADEVNFSHFEIEHSTNGSDFIFVSKVNGINSNGRISNYSYLHTRLAVGNNFYRLKLVDKDGTYRYSETVIIKLEQQPDVLTVFPNPVVGSFRINSGSKITQVQILGINGAMVRTVNYTGVPLDIADLRTGNYVIKCFDGKKLVGTAKIFKQ
jgi:uncharacterized protein (DUF1501 family)